MTADTRTGTRDGTRIGVLWSAVLLGPIAALTALEVGYVLAERACRTGQPLPLHLSFLGFLAVSLVAAALGWREWRRWGGGHAGDEGGREGRSRFLALLGLISGVFLGLVILAQWSANLFLHPCQ
jgi:hypothetical protein